MYIYLVNASTSQDQRHWNQRETTPRPTEPLTAVISNTKINPLISFEFCAFSLIYGQSRYINLVGQTHNLQASCTNLVASTPTKISSLHLAPNVIVPTLKATEAEWERSVAQRLNSTLVGGLDDLKKALPETETGRQRLDICAELEAAYQDRAGLSITLTDAETRIGKQLC